ncbi:MAG TPA: glycosyltransferase family 2 protein [Thermodesulfobacteriota bacterium]|nr:glycosyltransferase family 2 protein [Thermodesulfobacteriota bacterium]
MKIDTVTKYLSSRGVAGPWAIEGTEKSDYAAAVVIPALAENDLLFFTLDSLTRNRTDLLRRVLILIVINNGKSASAAVRENNRATLERLRGFPFSPHVQLGWIDAASPGQEIPSRVAGVGMARKIGFDLALGRVDFENHSPLLISLDADTVCAPNYLEAVFAHFRRTRAPGAVVPFCHQRGDTPEQDAAIRRYELFLRAYVLGLAGAGSPFAFHTVGSAMACTAEGYVRIGGMKVRQAAEDFYFLEHLAKDGGVSPLAGTVVYPSARTSSRVPFGTGRSMTKLMEEGRNAVLFYQPGVYEVLKKWLNLVSLSLDKSGETIEKEAADISGDLADFLRAADFWTQWEKLRKNFKTPSQLLKAFHAWFDALKTMKLIHHLSAGPFPRMEPGEVLPGLLRWAGLPHAEGQEAQLQLLRKRQNGCSPSPQTCPCSPSRVRSSP